MKAITDWNIFKLLGHDVVIFKGIVRDVFGMTASCAHQTCVDNIEDGTEFEARTSFIEKTTRVLDFITDRHTPLLVDKIMLSLFQLIEHNRKSYINILGW